LSILDRISESKELRRLKESELEKVGLKFVSNVTMNSLDVYLENIGLKVNLDLGVNFGTFDNTRFDFDNAEKEKPELIWHVILVDSLIDGLAYRVDSFKIDELLLIIDNKLQELRELFTANRELQTVFMSVCYTSNSWQSSWSTKKRLLHSHFESGMMSLCDEFSFAEYFDLQSTLENEGLERCFSQGKFLSASAPFSAHGLEAISVNLVNAICNRELKKSKVLVLDADNTLWGGVIGEVGVSGIYLSPNKFPGNIYWQMQHVFLRVKESGGLLALVTKNEISDIDAFFSNHENLVLKQEDFVSIKANWQDKAANILQLSLDLNLGLDSFVFIDDSDLEVSLVSSILPDVKTIQVPSDIGKYPNLAKELDRLFKLTEKSVSPDRTELYKVRAASKDLERSSSTKEEFLEALETKLLIRVDSNLDIDRIAEISQRTNQFNLSMKRYTPKEVDEYHLDPNKLIVTGLLKDRFGSSGISFAALAAIGSESATIDGLWASCRVLGREAERAFLVAILKKLATESHKDVSLDFTNGERNGQVLDLLESIQGVEKIGDSFKFSIDNISELMFPTWIEVDFDANFK
jgi:FkbH-like protein